MIKLNFLRWYLPERKRQQQQKMIRFLAYHVSNALLMGSLLFFTQWNLTSETQNNQRMQNQIEEWNRLSVVNSSKESKTQILGSSLSACFDALDQIHFRSEGLYSFEIHPPTLVLRVTPLHSAHFFHTWVPPLLQKSCMDHLSLSVETENSSAGQTLLVIQGTLKGGGS